MKYQFLLIQAMHLPEGSPYLLRTVKGTKKARLMGAPASGRTFPGDHPKKWRRRKKIL